LKTIQVIDHFLSDPKKLQQEAAKIKYSPNPVDNSNIVSGRSVYASKLEKKIMLTCGAKKISWGTQSGTFRITTKKHIRNTQNGFLAHSDGNINFISLLYLSRPYECHGGTAFYRHKKTGLEGLYNTTAIVKVLQKFSISIDSLFKLLANDSKQPHKWIQTDFIHMKFNRLLVFNGGLFHSAVFNFDKVAKSNKRLLFTCYGKNSNA